MAIPIREEDDEAWKTFRQWMRTNDMCPASCLTLATTQETGRGLMATKAIEANTIMVSVDIRFLITSETVQISVPWNVKSLNEQAALALFLAVLRHKAPMPSVRNAEFWFPYIDMTPASFNTIAANFPKYLFDLLPQQTRTLSERQISVFEADYEAAKKIVPELCSDDFKWGWYAANTRCITLHTELPSEPARPFKKVCTSRRPKIALAPFLDLLNHKPGARIIAKLNRRQTAFEITTLDGIEEGAECFINYGAHDNSFLLAEYGFVVKSSQSVHNMYDFISVDKELLAMEYPGRQHQNISSIFLKELEQMGMSRDFTLHFDQEPYRVMIALRLFALADDSEWKSMIPSWKRVVLGQQDIISETNESKALEMLDKLCRGIVAEAIKARELIAEWLNENRSQEESVIQAQFAVTLWESFEAIAQSHLKIKT